jgi:hypothetical protein
MKAIRLLMVRCLAGAVILVVSPDVMSQQNALKDQVVGEWILVSAYNERDGQKRDQFGPNPNGYLHLAPSGRIAYIGFNRDSPKFAANDRQKATDQEAQDVVRNSLAYVGTYKVNETDGVLEWDVRQSTYPNVRGLGKRIVKV